MTAQYQIPTPPVLTVRKSPRSFGWFDGVVLLIVLLVYVTTGTTLGGLIISWMIATIVRVGLVSIGHKRTLKNDFQEWNQRYDAYERYCHSIGVTPIPRELAS